MAEKQVPICSICHGEFDPTNFTLLSCSHVFHLECIKQWLNIQQKCPYCNHANVKAHNILIQRNNATGNEGNIEFSMVPLPNEALRLALIAYDRELHASSKDPLERAALETIFQEIRMFMQDEQNRQRRWELIKCAGFTIIFALFFLLFIKILFMLVIFIIRLSISIILIVIFLIVLSIFIILFTILIVIFAIFILLFAIISNYVTKLFSIF